MAYGRKGDLAQADLASAQAAFNRGDLMTARQLASRAKTRLPVGSPAWVQADDIVNVKPPTTPTNDHSKDKTDDIEPAPTSPPLVLRCWPSPRRKPRGRKISRRPSAARSSASCTTT